MLCDDCQKLDATVYYALGAKRCETCSKAFKDKNRMERELQMQKEALQALNHICGETDDSCQECCEHDDMEDGYCLNCGLDRTEDLMADAYDRYKDYLKYGDW